MKKIQKMLSILCVGACIFMSMGMDTKATETTVKDATISIDTRPDYTVYVNRTLNCVTVMTPNEKGVLTAVKSMVCSCGREGHETPEGTFQTSNYYDWRLLVDGSYGRYAVRFKKGILFHSVPYISKSVDSLEWDQYNLLGQEASLGCVRLSVEDAQWIYDNCKPGTTVVVYSDEKNVGALGKPEAIKIDAESPYKGWDPTDLNLNNPWLTAVGVNSPKVANINHFDYQGYADKYSDLKAVFGYDKNALFTHYITSGAREGRIAAFDK